VGNGYRSTRGRGRPLVKKIIFMAALSAIRFNESIANFYNAKKQEKNCKMIAIIAAKNNRST
jgi:hypothetical protein